MTALTCVQAQSILQSTVVDVDSRIRAQSHLVTCESCGAASDSQVAQMHDVVQRHAEGKLWIRISLAFLGVVQLSLALPWLMGQDSWWNFRQTAAELHLARDGAIAMVFTMAFADRYRSPSPLLSDIWSWCAMVWEVYRT